MGVSARVNMDVAFAINLLLGLIGAAVMFSCGGCGHAEDVLLEIAR
jgi:hypothetical protein